MKFLISTAVRLRVQATSAWNTLESWRSAKLTGVTGVSDVSVSENLYFPEVSVGESIHFPEVTVSENIHFPGVTASENIHVSYRGDNLTKNENEEPKLVVTNPPTLQDMTEKPILVGGDAVALYPSMDNIGTAELVSHAVEQTRVEFKNIDYGFMSIYLYLVLGREGFVENGLIEYIPKREKWIKSKAKSLAAQINRERVNWRVYTDDMDKKAERKMLALMTKVLVLVLMDRQYMLFIWRNII